MLSALKRSTVLKIIAAFGTLAQVLESLDHNNVDIFDLIGTLHGLSENEYKAYMWKAGMCTTSFYYQ